ncbi:MAG: MFS transporter [Phenylobacterium sp.]|uniref:MFS transporter n=1 Tax=Phenylobacterium sp. TaxID=1871053 RepID=UPI0027271620|nr:MFS transporter [Phenylobacterium sp.]MDO8409563.1 MFS transporter [Phenylobacterium sp.]
MSTPASAAPARWRLAAFASLGVPMAAAGLPLAVYLPPFYAQELGLGLGVVGAIFMLSRVWDALTDPLVGILSDRTRTRFGRRKPWIAAGAPVFALAITAIFMPALFGVQPGAVWLAVWLGILYLGWTAVQIPMLAWAGELATQYHARSRVQTFIQVSHALGLLLVLILPAGLDALAARNGVAASGSLKLAAMAGFVLVLLGPTLVAALVFNREPPATSAARGPGVARQLRSALRDPLILRVLASDFAVTLGQLIRSSLFVFFVSAYMGRPELAAGLFLLQFVFGVFAGPIWLKVGYRLGKHRTAVAGEVAQVAINLALFLVTPETLPLLLALTVAQGLAQGSGNLMLRAIVSDIADKQKLETGEDRAGLLFSAFSLASKAATAVAVGVALPLVAVLGFKPGAENTVEALLGLKLVFTLGPALAHAASALLIARFPLDESQHREIREALALRANAQPAE